MRTAHCSFLAALLLLPLSCKQSSSSVSIRALEHSGALSVLCRDTTTGEGYDINACPDPSADSDTGRHTMLMVTQTARGEVAVIDMTKRSIVDEDPAVPGTELLTVGAMPVSIVSTPGGASTFVATAEPGRPGIFVLPTSCIGAPATGQGPRDITQWSSCRLPAAPGEMAILTDSASEATGAYRKSCDSKATIDTDRTDCPANWDADERISPAGRRKLLVTLPTLGGIAILDARSLHGMAPGAFEQCPIERWLPLRDDVPSTFDQTLPADLRGTCTIEPRYSFNPPTSPFYSRPAGIAHKDGTLYVADLGTPLVHVVDVANPCDPRELDPLRPSSMEDPTRPVFTSDVAVSELTKYPPQRFVYAVDDYLGNLMAFDVTSTNREHSPIVFPGSPNSPFQAPDRIATNLNGARVKDILFVTHDVPKITDGTSNASTAIQCDPAPNSTSLATEYRTSSDYTEGAQPAKLRGTFAMAALSDGHVSIIDVEDWDAPCRRPLEANSSNTVNWRGCANDPQRGAYALSGVPTVSSEISCNVFNPHHPRSGRFVATNSTVGAHAPSLVTYPVLSTPSTASNVPGASLANARPKLLAVPFPKATGHSEVYISGSPYYLMSTGTASDIPADGAAALDVSPATSSNNSVMLPAVEPRAYLPTENFTLAYEGKLFDDRGSGYLKRDSLTLRDDDANFCSYGVQDVDTTAALSGDLFVASPSSAELAAFASTHTDTLQITSDFSDDDPYWASSAGAACALDRATGVSGIEGCRSYFGETDDFKSTRDLQIKEASYNELVLATKDGSQQTERNIHCCFPGTIQYTVRASNSWVLRDSRPMSKLKQGINNRCVPDCDPRKARLRTRAFEIFSTDTNCVSTPTAGKQLCPIGAPPATGAVCVIADSTKAVGPDSAQLPAGCIFDSLKARFALYSGLALSVRDMTFTWQVTGGFVPYQFSLSNNVTGSSVMPQSVTYAPNLNGFLVVDGVSGGVFEFVLDPFTIKGNPYL